MPILGHIDGLSESAIRGWALDTERPGQSLMVEIRVGGAPEALILAGALNPGVVEAGLGPSPACGFVYFFQRRLTAAQLASVEVLTPDGQPLPRALGDQPPRLYDRLFTGSFGVDDRMPEAAFLSAHYTRHNARRLEHLASLGLPLNNRAVIEFGAGVGDHTTFYLDRGCTVLATDARAENLALLKERLRDHPAGDRLSTRVVDVESPDAPDLGVFDIVHCYGLIYHLARPAEAIAHMARHAGDLMLVESKTAPAAEASIVHGEENAGEAYHSFVGVNSRPTRAWLREELARAFPYVGFPATQPDHEEFPADFSDLSKTPDRWPRAVLIGSRARLSIPLHLSPPAVYAVSGGDPQTTAGGAS